ncbi:MAG: flavodoxin [Acidimicrobiia bacterium]|nr:flavodoxin [Acidimicrobiia bacterium]
MAVLVAYASKHGSTEEIAAFIADRLRARGLDVEYAEAGDATTEGVDAAVVLSGVYAGRWLGNATHFIREHLDELRGMPVWLVSSGPVGDDPPPAEELVQIGDLPDQVDAVEHWILAGRIDAELLGFAERALVRALKVEVGDYRDWDAITVCADAVADHLLP